MYAVSLTLYTKGLIPSAVLGVVWRVVVVVGRAGSLQTRDLGRIEASGLAPSVGGSKLEDEQREDVSLQSYKAGRQLLQAICLRPNRAHAICSPLGLLRGGRRNSLGVQCARRAKCSGAATSDVYPLPHL